MKKIALAIILILGCANLNAVKGNYSTRQINPYYINGKNVKQKNAKNKKKPKSDDLGETFYYWTRVIGILWKRACQASSVCAELIP